MWVQISSGKGPDECELAVGLFLNTLLCECNNKGINAKVIKLVPGNYSGNFKSALVSLDDELIGDIDGTVLWIFKSPYKPNHRRKNWYIDVEVFREQAKVTFMGRDVRVEAMRSSGPGGQNVNKVETAVRATHLPTGLSVTASEERSQYMNKKLALARLVKLVKERNEKASLNFKRLMWNQHNTLVRGNPIRVYEGENFKVKIKDHDIKERK